MNAQDQKKLDTVEQAPQAEVATESRHQPWICPKCGSKIKYNPNRCTHCGYAKVAEARVIGAHVHKIWYNVALQMMVALLLGYFFMMFGFLNGQSLELFYGMPRDFLELCAQHPDMYFYTPVCGVLCCLPMIIVIGHSFYTSLTDKESISYRLRVILICTAILVWVPLLWLGIFDIVMTSFELRSLTSYDVFDLSVDFIPALAVTVACIALLPINKQLGTVPLNATDDDK